MLLKPIKKFRLTKVETVLIVLFIGAVLGIASKITSENKRQQTLFSKTLSGLYAYANGINDFFSTNAAYPAEATMSLPEEIKHFMPGIWPVPPFPGSYYDYDFWPANDELKPTYQISIRFCDLSEDCQAKAKKYLKNLVPATILDKWDHNSAIYYCIKGSCRSSEFKSVLHPGYCVNCGQAGKAN